jgi:hypothetical protein
MTLPRMVNSIVGFLRAGYPNGVPAQDYIPLLALLARRLSSEEVAEIADALAAEGDPVSGEALHRAIRDVTHEPPRPADIARVSAHLAAGGWPLAMPGA